MTNTIQTAPTTGAATGDIRTLLRLEGLAMLLTAGVAYFALGGNPWLFALLFFAPDLSFVGYTAGARPGAMVYNALHSYILPAALAAAGWLLQIDLLWNIALIFAAHIGFDRTLGYGLKYAQGFNLTHLGAIGRQAKA